MTQSGHWVMKDFGRPFRECKFEPVKRFAFGGTRLPLKIWRKFFSASCEIRA
jgi:hypothetical protein